MKYSRKCLVCGEEVVSDNDHIFIHAKCNYEFDSDVVKLQGEHENKNQMSNTNEAGKTAEPIDYLEKWTDYADNFANHKVVIPVDNAVLCCIEYATQVSAAKDIEIAASKEVFKWLLGYYDFPEPPETGKPRYYWRTHLIEKLKESGIEITALKPTE